MNIKKLPRHEKFSFPSTDNYFFHELLEIICFNLRFYKWTNLGPERWGGFLSVTQQRPSCRTCLPSDQNGEMQVLGNQQLKENYSLISKRVIFKQEAVPPWNFERKKIINKCTRFVLLSQLKECALSPLLKLAGWHRADRLFWSTWLVVIPNANLTHGWDHEKSGLFFMMTFSFLV